MIIPNVDRYRVVEPLFAGVRVVVNALGEKYSPAYIQGISGAAFRVAGICPCAPTCSAAMSTRDFIKLLGYELVHHTLGWKDDEVAEKMQALIPKIKDEVRAGRPVLVWHAFTNAEWDVVCGSDDAAGTFIGRGSYMGCGEEYASAKQSRPAEAVKICPAFGAMCLGKKTSNLDAKAAETAALKEAVRHARQERKGKLGDKEALLEGLRAYSGWVDDWKKPDKKREVGDCYCWGVYRSTHRAAADFLKEIAPGHSKAAEALIAAAGEFKAEADALDKAESLIWWKSPAGADAERNAKLWPILAEARDHYAKGIDAIEKALPLL